MATWKDGAAYAPVERPEGFATPVTEPLPAGEPYRAETPGPLAHPTGFGPMPPQQPLHLIGDKPASARDPKDAFTVASSLLTAGPDGAHGPRNPRTPFPTTVQSALDTSPPPPTGDPLPPPPGASGHFPPPSPARGPEGAWAPPPPVMVPYSGSAGTPVPVTDSHRVLARVSAGLCFVGFVVGSTSAFMLLAAGIIGLRTKPLTKALGYMATSVGAAGMLVQWMLDGQPFPFTALWATMSLACCLGFLVFSLKPR